MRGNCVRTVDISVEKKLYLSGLAVNAEGTLLAVSIQNSHEIAIYSLPEMTLLSRFGGPGRFRFPEKLCFSPNTGNLLVSCGHISGVQVCPLTSRYVACCHIRIVPQEVTVDGTSVRGYGFFRIDGVVWAVTANVHVVVVGTNSDDQQVYVFDIVSGALIRSFGERGGLLGHVCGCVGLRVSPDGKHIIIAESDNRRVSLFSLTGKFVRSYGEGTLRSAWDVDYAPNGDIVVADQELSCISVFSAPDGTMLRTIDVPDIRNNSPTALAVHAGNLYVLTRKRKPHLVILE